MLLLHEILQDRVKVVQTHDEPVVGPLVTRPTVL